MADTPIADFPAATAATGGDFYGIQGGADKKFTQSAAGAALNEAADAAAQRTALGLGTAAEDDTGDFATAAQGATADAALPATSAAAASSIVVKATSGSYTVGTTSALELRGGVIYVTGAGTITIPAVAAGVSFTVITIGAVAVSIDPNASDLIYLDGTALDDGDKITNLSTAGDIAVITYYDATGWHATTNGWTDGGA